MDFDLLGRITDIETIAEGGVFATSTAQAAHATARVRSIPYALVTLALEPGFRRRRSQKA